MIVFGCDPDYRATAWATFDTNEYSVLRAGVVVAEHKLKGSFAVAHMMEQILNSPTLPPVMDEDGVDIVVCEYPKAYPKSEVQPNNLIGLAMIAGVMFGRMRGEEGIFPHPQEWKGTISKSVHQKRILTKLGWRYTQRGKQLIPNTTIVRSWDIRPSEWTHVIDAIGLAMWGAEQIRQREAVARAAQRRRERLALPSATR